MNNQRVYLEIKWDHGKKKRGEHPKKPSKQYGKEASTVNPDEGKPPITPTVKANF